MKKILTALAALLLLPACSVFMANSGTPTPDTSMVIRGSSREIIEASLYKPARVKTMPDGTVKDIYYYTVGDDPDPNRAILHAVFDAYSLFLWEIFATPLELSRGDDYRAVVIYDDNDIAKSVRIRKR